MTAIFGDMDVRKPVDISETIEVTPQREPITLLQAGLDALTKAAERSFQRFGDFEPRQAEALLVYISKLERKATKDDTTIDYLAEQLSALEPANPHDDAEYDRKPTPQSFYMEVEK